MFPFFASPRNHLRSLPPLLCAGSAAPSGLGPKWEMFWKERKKSKIETNSCRHINMSRGCIIVDASRSKRQLRLKLSYTLVIWRACPYRVDGAGGG